jgi:purine-nucleoside phosphorylase
MARLTPPELIAVVAGSGIRLESLPTRVERVVSFAEAGLPTGAVPGHDGRFLHGLLGRQPVIVQCGRLHLYEGFSLEEVGMPVRYLHRHGVRGIVFTNAAGGLRLGMKPGDLLAVSAVRPFAPRRGTGPWPSPPRRVAADFTVAECDHEGDYVWVLGPNYETRAEVRALARSGAMAVGMSTGPEMAVCRALGIRCAAVSCITNNCLQPTPLSHEHVTGITAAASARIVELLKADASMKPRR